MFEINYKDQEKIFWKEYIKLILSTKGVLVEWTPCVEENVGLGLRNKLDSNCNSAKAFWLGCLQ